MTDKNKEKRVFYITHSGELLFWLVVIMLVIGISSVIYISKEKNDENDYRIFLQDVDGLIVGSPVRMMGIEVGHVVKIKPTNNEVYVKFVLTNPDVYIPQGTKATVEFSGMAGSKSLELYLPDENTFVDNDTPLITVMPPKRLHDALGLLNDMFDKICDIIFTSSSFSSKLNDINIIRGKDANIKKFLEYSDDFLDNSNQKASDIRNNIEGFKKK